MNEEKPKKVYAITVTILVTSKSLSEATNSVMYCFDYRDEFDVTDIQTHHAPAFEVYGATGPSMGEMIEETKEEEEETENTPKEKGDDVPF